MRHNEWKGLITAASPYALPPGVTAEQWNVQCRKAGQLTSRPGVSDIVANAAAEAPVYAIYRLTYGSGQQDSLLVWRAGTDNNYQLDLLGPSAGFAPDSWVTTTLAASSTLPTSRPSIAQNRHGHIYTHFGHDIEPVVYRPGVDDEALPVGMPAPTVAPVVTPTGNGYFIERVDVLSGGGSYWRSPNLIVTGGSPVRPAQLRAVVQGGSIVSINVVDGGSGFATLPTITIDETGVKGGGFLGFAALGVDPGQQGFAAAFTKTVTSISGTTITFASTADRDAVKVGMSVVALGLPATFITAVSTGSNTATTNGSGSAGSVTATFSSGIASGSFTGTNTHAFTDSVTNPTIAIDQGGTTVGIPASYSSVSGNYSAIIPLTPTAPSAGAGASALVYFQPAASTTLNNEVGGSNALINFGTTFGASNRRFKNYSNSYFYNRSSPVQRPSPDNAAIVNHRYWYNNYDLFAAITPGFTYRFAGRQVLTRLDTVNGVSTLGFSSYLTYAADYHTVAYRYYAGARSQVGTSDDTSALWQWAEAPVQINGSGVPYIDIALTPAAKTPGVAYQRGSNFVAPSVRIFLYFCPDAWLWSASPDSGYTPVSTGFGNPGTDPAANYFYGSYAQWLRGSSSYNRALPPTAGNTFDTNQRWWHPGSASNTAGILKRPVVDFRSGPLSTDAAGLAVGTVQILNAGQGMEADTVFGLHFEQANANRALFYQPATTTALPAKANTFALTGGYGLLAYAGPAHRDNNPLMTVYDLPSSSQGPFHDPSYLSDTGLGSQRFYFSASTPSGTTAQGLPAAVLASPAPSVIAGGGFYKTNETATFKLKQRTLSGTVFSDSQTYTFRASQLTPVGTTARIVRVDISQPGAGYVTAPTLVATGGGGVGLQLSAAVTGGQITSVGIADPGVGYTTPPVITTDSRTATLIPVMRPAMRGSYRCAYRFADWSATQVATITATTIAGSPQVLVSSTVGLAPGMVVESTDIPWHSRIRSIVGSTLTLSANATTSGNSSCIVRDMTKPIIYSSFSPITDVDTSNSASAAPSQMLWSLAGVVPPDRAGVVEFFRTSADQSLVFYRLEQYGVVASGAITIQGTDTLTDEQLFDTDRPFYAAVPVVLPNGALNAYRFGQPRKDMSVCVAYNDRLFYAVSTSGRNPNTIFFSEFDEFESCPEINELTIQNNVVSADTITALAPFSIALMVFQANHCYSLDYNTSPNEDAVISLVAQRGCLNQRCFDICDYNLYAMDERGIYSMSPSGDVQALSDAVGNYFFDGLINFGQSHTFFLRVEKSTRILRAYVCVDSTTFPDLALCYRLSDKTWWIETHPTTLTDSCHLRRLSREHLCYSTAHGDMLAPAGDRDIAYRSIASVSVTSAGSGYVEAPTVTVDATQPAGQGTGARLQAVISNGQVTDILVLDSGSGYGVYGAASGESVRPFTATVPLLFSAPPAGGTTATGTGTALQPNQIRYQTVGWRFKTGAMEYVTDGTSRKGEQMADRSVILTYEPTASSHRVDLREFPNNAASPRPNAVRRDRGTGFVSETDGARTSLDMSASRSALGQATGVAKAQFAGRSYEDSSSSDRHLAVEFAHVSQPVLANVYPSPAIIHTVEVRGVIDG